MRLLIVCQVVDRTHHNLGFFHQWIAAFAARAASVIVIANEVGEYDLPANVRVLSLGKENGVSRFRRYLTFLRLIVSYSNQYDAVFCHMNPEFVIAGSWWWVPAKKKIALWYVHGSVTLRLRLALLLARTAFTVNKESLRIRHPKVLIVGHGIDTDFFMEGRRVQHDELFLVCVGRISPTKRIDRVIEVARLIIEKGVPLRLSIIGGAATSKDKEYEAKVADMARGMPRVSFTGPVPQAFVRDALLSADVSINLSLTQSVDKAVLEAALCGALPVTTNLAFKDMLSPYELFVEDSPAIIADTVVTAWRRPDSNAVRAELRAHISKDHSLPRLVDRIIEEYGRM